MHWPSLDSVNIVQGHTLVRITTMTVSYYLWESKDRDPGPKEKGKKLRKRGREGRGRERGREGRKESGREG